MRYPKSMYGNAMASESEAGRQGIDARDAAASNGDWKARLVDDEARLRLAADGRDCAADERDAVADKRDRRADMRDDHADVRDEALSDRPDRTGARDFAAQDRRAAAADRVESAEDRLRARDDRKASTWDRSVAQAMQTRLMAALNDADTLPEATLIIGQAQGMLISEVGGNAAEAIMEIGDRADRDNVGLQEAARRILAEGLQQRTGRHEAGVLEP